MDFEKLLQQREAKEAVTPIRAIYPEEMEKDFEVQRARSDARMKGVTAKTPSAKPKATRNRQQVAGSKRSTWKMRAWFVQPETASRLRAYVNRQQEAGQTIDASDVVDQAIAAWLSKKGA